MLCREVRCCQEASSLLTEPHSQQIWLSWEAEPSVGRSHSSVQSADTDSTTTGGLMGRCRLATKQSSLVHNTTQHYQAAVQTTTSTSIINQNINKPLMKTWCLVVLPPPCKLIVWRWQLMLCCCRPDDFLLKFVYWVTVVDIYRVNVYLFSSLKKWIPLGWVTFLWRCWSPLFPCWTGNLCWPYLV